MVDMRDDIRRLDTITDESSGWTDVLLEGDLRRPMVTVEEGEEMLSNMYTIFNDYFLFQSDCCFIL